MYPGISFYVSGNWEKLDGGRPGQEYRTDGTFLGVGTDQHFSNAGQKAIDGIE
jgi:hypothetical protein